MMKTPPSTRMLWLVIAGLVLLNLVSLSRSFFPHPGAPARRPDRPHAGFIDFPRELHFSDTQRTQFDRLKDAHFAEVEPIRDSIRLLKGQMMAAVTKQPFDPVHVRQLANELATKVARNETNTLLHFADIRALCTPDQQVRFDELVEEIFGPKGRPRP